MTHPVTSYQYSLAIQVDGTVDTPDKTSDVNSTAGVVQELNQTVATNIHQETIPDDQALAIAPAVPTSEMALVETEFPSVPPSHEYRGRLLTSAPFGMDFSLLTSYEEVY